MSEIDLSKYNIRTDLVIENDNIIHKECEYDGVKVTTTKNDGNYITLSFLDITDYNNREKVGKVLEKELKKMFKLNNIKDDDYCLVIGLGNSLSTPDSLGVRTLDNLIITSHLFELGKVDDGIRRVSSFIPGVMANTGIESGKMIKAIIDSEKPDFVIAIDALAARLVERINKTIQITDTGIHPGSGIGNNRLEISKKTMGIPVIAIGVPTVTLSSTIVYDTLGYLYKHISYIKGNEAINKLSYMKYNYKNKLKNISVDENDKHNLMGLVGMLSDDEVHSLIDEVLNKTELNLIVTPTEIDFLIDKLSNLISSSLNNALHRQITHN